MVTRIVLLAMVVSGGLVEAADPKPGKTRADEPLAKSMSLDRAASYLDVVATDWTEQRKCGACHTNVPYLMARPALKDKPSSQEQSVRRFFEQRVTHWDRGQKGDAPRWDTEVLVTGVTLAFHDARTTGKLHATTRQALDRIWRLQGKNGAWNWLKCDWPPMEHDDYFGAVFVAVGVGIAPDNYAQTEAAQAGLKRLQAYFDKTPPPSLHHQAWLLWASQKVDGLMTPQQQQKTIATLRAKQREDGGWSLASLGDWTGNDGRKSDPHSPSDGYGTGLVVYILRQAGVRADDPALQRGVAWLRANQRESGRWFTHSLNRDSTHYIANAGTAFALLALKECE